MKPPEIDRPQPTDANAKKQTGKSMQDWFGVLDAEDALTAGRRKAIELLLAAGVGDDWWATTIAVEHEKARGAVERDGKPKGYAICVTKTVAVQLEDVYAAWTDPAALSEWFGPKCSVELAVGGRFENADGDRGEFKRIRENKDLRFTWENAARGAGSLVDVAFAAKPKGKTGITINHSRIQGRRDADELRECWGIAMEGLKQILESGAGA